MQLVLSKQVELQAEIERLGIENRSLKFDASVEAHDCRIKELKVEDLDAQFKQFQATTTGLLDSEQKLGAGLETQEKLVQETRDKCKELFQQIDQISDVLEGILHWYMR